MTERTKKLRLIQLSLLIIGILVIVLTYSKKENFSQEKIVSRITQEKVKKQLANQSQTGDVFYNIEYSGLDLSGNRYILKSKEAINNNSKENIVDMKSVEAVFYFKNNTFLNIISNKGIYNNKTLDMIFIGDVKATYEGSELFAQKAEYSNKKSFLTVTENVKIVDFRGTMFADKLLFDIKKQSLNIASFNNNKINANVNLK
jgi:lipopolysaccharide assembly outer membrane protein LptD (OstA)